MLGFGFGLDFMGFDSFVRLVFYWVSRGWFEFNPLRTPYCALLYCITYNMDTSPTFAHLRGVMDHPYGNGGVPFAQMTWGVSPWLSEKAQSLWPRRCEA